MNVVVKICNIPLTNLILQHINRITFHKWTEFIPGMQRCFNICKSITVVYHIKGMKDNKIQQLFMMKMFNKLCTEGVYLNMIQVIYNKPTGVRLKIFPLRSFLLLLFNIVEDILGRKIKKVKEGRHPDKKGRRKVVFADMIFYIENPKDFIKKLLELVNEFGEVTRHKINM